MTRPLRFTHTCPGCGGLICHAPEGEPCYCAVSGVCPCGRYEGLFVPMPGPARALTAQAIEDGQRRLH